MLYKLLKIAVLTGGLLVLGSLGSPSTTGTASLMQVETACAQSPAPTSVRCYSSYTSCWWNCDTFWRCQPGGDCSSVSGQNPYDSSTCGGGGGGDEPIRQ